jgi:hypothetical protein
MVGGDIMNCQLQNYDELVKRNSWIDDTLQSLIRKYRHNRKKILISLGLLNAGQTDSDINLEEINAGDTVRVRSKAEIKSTLNRYGKIRGCSFLKEMYKDCGKEFKVYKKLEYFWDESRQKMLRTNGIFLLEDSYCTGKSAYLKPCNRNCFYFWHKNWLEKVVPGSHSRQH